MKLLVTGVAGFLGKNLLSCLTREKDITVLPYDVSNSIEELQYFLSSADVLIHLAGTNRPLNPEDFFTGNVGFTSIIVEYLEKIGKSLPIIFSSSIQAELNNEYGKSKRLAEERLKAYAERTGAPVKIFRFANIFGKWGRPNYNSAVITFCYNIARELPITIHDPAAVLKLLYVDDAIYAIIKELKAIISKPNIFQKGLDFAEAGPIYETTVGQVADTIRMIHELRKEGHIPDFSNSFVKKLASTYLSYVEPNKLAIVPVLKRDERGSLFELLKMVNAGQIFVSTTKPGEVRGNHYHDTKFEKFCLIKGKAKISLRRIDSKERIDFDVDDKEIKVLDIPAGYAHKIKNTGDEDCIIIFWANEIFNPLKPDTWYLEV